MPSYNPRQALAGKRIVVTRAPEQSVDLTQALQGAGAEVMALPLVRFVEEKDTESLDAALRELGSFDWLIFTSANAVRFLAKRGKELGLLPPDDKKAGPRVAAVGPASAKAARGAGFRVDLVAARHDGGELAAHLIAELGPRMRGTRVLLPRSNRADDTLPSRLKEAGARVIEVVVYRTEQSSDVDPGLLEEIRRGSVDVITLASHSAFQALTELIGPGTLARIAMRTSLAAIGPTTAAAIQEFGLPAPIEARDATSAGMVEAIIQHYQVRETSFAPPGGRPGVAVP
jgi:uroporphyrinogen III methyltransferase/synthase